MARANPSMPPAHRPDPANAKVPLAGQDVASLEPADSRLRRAVLARLIADPLVSTAHLSVTAAAGRVTLSGYVTSHAQKDAASANARRVGGVEAVINQVMVAVPSPTAIYPALAEPPAKHHRTRPPSVAPRPRLLVEVNQSVLHKDVRRLIEKCRPFFDVDAPNLDQAAADRLFLAEVAGTIEAAWSDL